GLTGPAGQDGKDAPHLDISVKDGKPGLDGKDGEVRIVYKDKEGNEKEVASLDDGLQFGADNDVVVNRKLNTKLDIKGGAEAASADRNIVTTANADGSIQLDLAKDLKLADNEGNAGSITLGKPGTDGKDSAKLDGSGLTLTGKDGKPGPSITQDGINAGDKVIAGVKDGEKPTDAVNKGQLDKVGTDLTEKGMSFEGNKGETITKSLGDTLAIKGGLADDAEATAENLRVDVENGELVIKMSKDLKGLENIVVGSDGKDGKPGVSINGEDGSIGLTGPAGKDGKPGASTTITVIKDGKPGLDGQDGETEVRVVYEDKNGDQQQIANLNDGLKFGADEGDDLAVKLNEKLDIKGGDANITTSIDEEGIKVNLAKNLDLGEDGSLSTGKTVVNNDGVKVGESVALGDQGLTIKDGPTITKDGINAGDKVIAGVKDGEKPTDAVNKGQLDKVGTELTNKGMSFEGNKGETITKSLGDTLAIKGGLADAAEATAENLRVDVENGELVIKMSKDLKGLENIVVGSDGKDGKPGVSINGEDGSIGLTGPAGKDGKSPELNISVKDGSPGLDGKDGEVRIVYKDKDGNEKEVASLDDGLQFGADNDVVVNRKLNTKLDIKGGAEAASADRNIVTTANADGSIQLDLAKDLKLADNEGNAGSITLGKPGTDGKDSAKLDGSGLALTGKDGKAGPSITQDGINAGNKKIIGVAKGEADTDAVNVAQLKDVQAKGDVGLEGIAEAFGGGAEYDKETGQLKAPNYTAALGLPEDKAIGDGVEEGFRYVGDTLTDHEGRIEENTTNITNITQGTAGLVKLDGDRIVIDNDLAKGADTFDFSNDKETTRTLTGVSAGKVKTDAVNVSQLAESLGADSLDKDGNWQGPTFVLNQTEGNEEGDIYHNVGDAITNIDGRVIDNTTNINNITSGKSGLVQLSEDGKSLVIDNVLAESATAFDFSNGEETRTLSGVTAGKADTDAVNVAQLKDVQAKGDVGLEGIAEAFGGGAEYDKETGQLKAPNYTAALGLPEDQAIDDGVEEGLKYVGGKLADHEIRIDQNTTNINKIKNGQAGLVKLDGNRIVIDNSLAKDAMTFDFSSYDNNPRTLTGVAKGELSQNSVDAVNGSQLFETNQKIENITNLNGQNLEGIADAFGGNAEVKDGVLSGVDFTDALKADKPITNVNDGFGYVTGRLDDHESRLDGHDTKLENHEHRITNIEGDINNITGGKAGLIKLSEDGKSLVVDNVLAKDANTFDISNGDEGRTLTGVNDGKVAKDSKDAINGGQLYASNQSIADMFGGGATVDKDGYVSTPEYNFGDNNVFNNVGDSLTYLNNKVQEHGIFSLDREKNQIIIADNKDINKETVVNMGNRKIVGVANGKVEKGSQEAVNGGQLWETNQQVASNTNQIKHINNTLSHYNNRINNLEKKVHQNRKVASAGIAGAMAMSSIPYIDYAKYSIGMGVASYDGEHALSLGFEFKMSENGRFRIQGSYDTQNKVGVGVGMAFEL
ncbi:YadA-like family protein, partial [Ignatzschineria cameli]|uniref:YadA-like family protein n=1 Tax=Ignatzschineria cameli TaxID=2182793 RepID=UPI000D61BF3C